MLFSRVAHNGRGSHFPQLRLHTTKLHGNGESKTDDDDDKDDNEVVCVK